MKTIPLTQGRIAKVSDRDYAYLRRFNWYCSGKPSKRYAQTHRIHEIDPERPILMHRVVAIRAGYGNSPQVDHRNGNSLDNRRCNLRPATNAQNQMNRHKVIAVSGVKGVYPNTNGRWQARLMKDRKLINLGTYDSIQEAAEARRRGELEYFGEFAQP